MPRTWQFSKACFEALDVWESSQRTLAATKGKINIYYLLQTTVWGISLGKVKNIRKSLTHKDKVWAVEEAAAQKKQHISRVKTWTESPALRLVSFNCKMQKFKSQPIVTALTFWATRDCKLEEAIVSYLLCLIGDYLHVNSPVEESEQQVLQNFECLTEPLQSLLHCPPPLH